MLTSRLAVALCLALASLTACASAPPAVDLSGQWPAQPADYDAAVDAWTRSAEVRRGVTGGLDHVFSVSATALSAEWRAAFVAEQGRRLKLTRGELDALAEAQRAEAEKTWQFEIALITDQPRWNDLHKWPRSTWRIAMITPDGRAVLPEKVVVDKRQPDVVKSYFPHVAPFAKVYVVTFPRQAADGTANLPDGAPLRLDIGGALGLATLEWAAK